MSIYRHSYIVDAEGRFIQIGALQAMYDVRYLMQEIFCFLKKNNVYFNI